MIDVNRHLACDRLRRRQGVLVIEDRSARNAGLFELADPVRDRLPGGFLFDQRASSSRCAMRCELPDESRVEQPLVVAQHARDFLEVAIVGGADRDVAVGAAERLIRSRQAMRGAERRRHLARSWNRPRLPTPTAQGPASTSDVSMCCPTPVALRWCSAPRMPSAANSAAPRSVIGTPTFTGRSSACR